jgi:hypothetical protein
MVHPSNAGKLLLFPLSTPVPEAVAQNWDLRILEKRDNLVNALEYLRNEYEAMLAGNATTAADEVSARVETSLSNQKVSWYTWSGKSGSMGRPRETQNERFCYRSPCESAAVTASKGSMSSASR